MRKVLRWLLVSAIIAAYPLTAFYPYEVRTPIEANGAEWLADGTLRFGSPGIVGTAIAPEWLDDAKRSHRLEVTLRVRALESSQTGPARILTVSKDPKHRNLTLGQDADRLVIRLRTPETDANGLPERYVAGVFAGKNWVAVALTVVPGQVRVAIDGQVRLEDRLPDRPLELFDSTYRLALGNELTVDRPWVGEIAQATVKTGTARADYMEPERLERPRRLRNFHHLPMLVPFRDLRAGDAVVNLLGFVPLGTLIGWLVLERRRSLPGWTILPIFLMSVIIEIGQWWMPTRYMSIDDLLLNTLGGAIGLLLTRRLRRESARSGASFESS
jgi:hypothetical protein